MTQFFFFYSTDNHIWSIQSKAWVTEVPEGSAIEDHPTLASLVSRLNSLSLPAPELPPHTVSMWQARAALKAAGLFDIVDAAIKASSTVGQAEAWEYATTISRDAQVITNMTALLNLTEKQVDDLFLAASKITV